jgi:hypothetical protein
MGNVPGTSFGLDSMGGKMLVCEPQILKLDDDR